MQWSHPWPRRRLPNSGCTDNHITFLSHSLKQEAACCCTPCMLSIPCCSGSPTARWSRHLVKDDTNRHIPMHTKQIVDLGSQHPDLADPLTNMSTNMVQTTNGAAAGRPRKIIQLGDMTGSVPGLQFTRYVVPTLSSFSNSRSNRRLFAAGSSPPWAWAGRKRASGQDNRSRRGGRLRQGPRWRSRHRQGFQRRGGRLRQGPRWRSRHRQGFHLSMN